MFDGTISGFDAKDQIDLADNSYGPTTTLGYTANSGNTGGTLTVNDGFHSANLALLGNYTSASFAASSDGHGGTLVSDAAVSSQALLAQPKGCARSRRPLHGCAQAETSRSRHSAAWA